jgi:3-phytase
MLVCLVALLPLALATPASAGILTVRPVLETPPLFDDDEGGNADVDDPAILVHPTDRERSRVLVTAKNGGLYTYDLNGGPFQAFPTPPGGRFNNVDLFGDIAVVTDRGLDKLRFYRITDGILDDVTAPDAPWLFSTSESEVETQRTGYGLAVHGSYAVVTRRHTPMLGIFRIIERGGVYTYTRTDTLTLPSTFRLRDGTVWTPCLEPGELPQSEGLVVDPVLGRLYIAQEDVALWRIQIHSGRFVGRPRMIERTREFGLPAAFDEQTGECDFDREADPGEGGRIASDVEGLTIYQTGRLSGTLLVSSQSDSTFFTYDRLTNRPLSRFAVRGVQDCDGAAVVSTPLPGFPHGLLVVHDGDVVEDRPRDSTNVKYVDAGFLRQHR